MTEGLWKEGQGSSGTPAPGGLSFPGGRGCLGVRLQIEQQARSSQVRYKMELTGPEGRPPGSPSQHSTVGDTEVRRLGELPNIKHGPGGGGRAAGLAGGGVRGTCARTEAALAVPSAALQEEGDERAALGRAGSTQVGPVVK